VADFCWFANSRQRINGAESLTESTTIFLTDEDVRNTFTWDSGVEALRAAYGTPATEAMFPPRTMARGDGLWLRTMAGVLPDGSVFGAKHIAAGIKIGYASYLIPLFDQGSMHLLALLEANSITGFRTASTSALAADHLVNGGPLRVGVIGSGFEAKAHLRALASVRPVESATVFSPNPASRARFIEELSDLGIPITSAESAESAVQGMNTVICAARSRDESPTFLGSWMKPGMTVLSIGSTLPEQREIGTDAVEMADVIVSDMPDEVAHDTGDMIAAAKAGVSFEDKMIPLDMVVSGQAKGRTSPEQIVLYKSVGGAIQDLAIAWMCVQRARELNIGTPLPVSLTPAKKG